MSDILILALVHMIGLVSPGPDFVLVSQHALLYNRSIGIYTALGIASATLVHSLYCTIGLGYFIQNSPKLFTTIKYIGAMYLITLGIKSLFKKASGSNQQNKTISTDSTKAFTRGFLCNLLNPKATLFFISVLSIILDNTDSPLFKSIYIFEIFFLTFFWFSMVTITLTHHKYRSYFYSYQNSLLKFFGICLILLGAKLAFVELS